MFQPGTVLSLPKPQQIEQGSCILHEENVFVVDNGEPVYAGKRKNIVKVLGPSANNHVSCEIIASMGTNPFPVGAILLKPVANLMNGLDCSLVVTEEKYLDKLEAGGHLEGFYKGKKVVLDSADKGGLSVGSTHKQGGIKGSVGTEKRPIEFEDKEIILTADVSDSDQTYDLDGHKLTARQVASKLNSDHGGVSFADGGDLGTQQNPVNFKGSEIILTAPVTSSTKTYMLNGKQMTPKEIASQLNVDSGGVALVQ